MNRRILSMLLIFLMLFSLLPASAFAEELEGEAAMDGITVEDEAAGVPVEEEVNHSEEDPAEAVEVLPEEIPPAEVPEEETLPVVTETEGPEEDATVQEEPVQEEPVSEEPVEIDPEVLAEPEVPVEEVPAEVPVEDAIAETPAEEAEEGEEIDETELSAPTYVDTWIARDATGGVTRDGAVAWAVAQIGKSLDYDGYPAYDDAGNPLPAYEKYQCVDLIYFYYQALGASFPGGNAINFSWNTLPEGWTRIPYSAGVRAQPGDIAVWSSTENPAGHVAIVESADETAMNVVEQNFNYQHSVTKNWTDYDNSISHRRANLVCFIRPDFAGSNAPKGCVDSLWGAENGTIHMSGWAFDYDNTAENLAIHVWVGSVGQGGGVCYKVKCNGISRPDVADAYGNVGNNHGFDFEIPVTERGSQVVYVYAIDVGDTFVDNPCIGSGTVNISANYASALRLNATTLSMSEATKQPLSVSYAPTDLKNTSFTWSSSNTSVATASDGLVTAHGVGTATITVSQSTPYGTRSATCKVTVTSRAPKITSHPTATSAVTGTRATFKVEASGSNLSYQWQYQKPGTSTWVDSHGVNYNKATFTPDVSLSMNGYLYRCKVWNSAGTVYSNAAKLTVTAAAPKITTQPVATSAATGTKATFKVVASGSNLSYQWQYRKTSTGAWTDSRGVNYNKATFTPDVSLSMNGYDYRCKVSNSVGTVYSNAAKLTVTAAAPKITTHPVATSVATGTKASFKVVASGSNLTYQWQYQKPGTSTWVDSRGVNYNKATFTPDASLSMNGYLYRCKVSNSVGTVYSNAAKLTVTAAAPVITTHPVATSAATGTKASFKVVASGSNLTYQWQYQKPGTSTWVDSRGVNYNKATFTPDVSLSMNGYLYRCKVSNSAGTVYSNPAKLTVY